MNDARGTCAQASPQSKSFVFPPTKQHVWRQRWSCERAVHKPAFFRRNGALRVNPQLLAQPQVNSGGELQPVVQIVGVVRPNLAEHPVCIAFVDEALAITPSTRREGDVSGGCRLKWFRFLLSAVVIALCLAAWRALGPQLPPSSAIRHVFVTAADIRDTVPTTHEDAFASSNPNWAAIRRGRLDQPEEQFR